MTRNLRLFAIFSAWWAVVYLAVLYWQVLQAHAPAGVMASTFIFFIVLLTSAEAYLARTDNPREVRYGLRVRYSGISAAASCSVSAIWIVVLRHKLWLAIGLGLASVIVVLAVAWLSGQDKIKGMPKEQLFP